MRLKQRPVILQLNRLHKATSKYKYLNKINKQYIPSLTWIIK